jgi:hypothetical protein
MEAAHNDPHVQAAASAFLRAPVRGMVKILATSLYTFLPSVNHRAIVIAAGIDNEFHPAAYEMMAATNAIYGMDSGTREAPGPRSYARGAVLEQIGEALLRLRRPSLLTEQCVGPLDGRSWTNGMSDSIDFCVPDAPQELWDAKSDVYTIKSKHLNQFDLLLDMADPGSIAGFITLDERITLVEHLAEFRGFRHPLYAYVYENFETMSYEMPITRVDALAGGGT